MDIDLEKNKQKFLELFRANVHRDGSEDFLSWLEKSDFFEAPASTKFHSNMPGGLCFHTLNVFDRFTRNLAMQYGENWQDTVSLESATIMSLLHDVCKVDCYKVELRNVKIDGEWVKQPYYAYDEALPYGHGEKSVYIISSFFKLSREESMAINWHMGGFDQRVLGGSYALSNAYYQYPVAVLLHVSDVEATYLDEICQK
jgi:hypothetical protein